jgi:glycosyltransferase involved in cell wall biosynthesis
LNILFLASSADWHVDLWSRYFTNTNKVFLFSDKENYLPRQEFKNITVIESSGFFGWLLNSIKSKSHLLFQINKIVSIYYFSRKIRKIILDQKIDVIHAHSLYFGYLSSFIKLDIPIVFTPQGSSIIIHAQKNYIYGKMAEKAYNAASLITGDSLIIQNKGYLVGAKKQNNIIIQNGVDTKIFFEKNNNFKKRYNMEKDEILIFSPRAITPLYNIDVIIESLNLLKLNNYKFKCMFSFAFGGEYSKKLREKVSKLNLEKNIIWLGYIDYAEMAKYYNASDIVVSIPSSDSSPKSVYEAMFCKKAIIISNLEWSYEILPEDNVVVRVEPKNSGSLFRALEKLINDIDYRMEIAKNAKELAHKYFNYAKNMELMEGYMVNLIKKN